jgi:Secretion system C-terminal sorting domain/Dockerin type I domain
MKKVLSLLLCVAFFAPQLLQAQAPAIQWQNVINSTFANTYVKPYCIQQTTDSGYIVAGLLNNTAGTEKPSVVKYSKTGAIQWSKIYNASARIESIKQTPDGGYIAAGYTDEAGTSGYTGGRDGWVIKLTDTGTITWSKAYGTANTDYFKSIALTKTGGYVMLGTTYKPISVDYDILMVTITSTGTVNGTYIYGTYDDDYAANIQETFDGGYIFAGSVKAANRDVSYVRNSRDIWVVKTSFFGSIDWQKTYGGTMTDAATCIQQTKDSGYIVSGVTLSSDSQVTNFKGVADGWVFKLNSTGTLQWQKTLGGTLTDYANSVQQTKDGGYIVAGYTASVDGDVVPVANRTNDNFWVTKLSSTGSLQWQKVMGGTGNEEATSIQQTNDGGYAITGYTTSMDGDVIGKTNTNNSWWVVKLSPDTIKGPIYITYPNGGDSLFNCNTDTIRFEAIGTSTFYNIDYSVNGGTTWVSIAVNAKITNGKYAWKVPTNLAPSTNCLIRLYDKLTPTLRDSSNAVFSISKPITITSPNGGEVLTGYTYKTITWTTDNKNTSNAFSLSYSVNGGSTWTIINNNYITTSGNNYNWLVPTVVASSTCFIKIVDVNNTCKTDTSNVAFTINPPKPIFSNAAAAGKSFKSGESFIITWDSATIVSSSVNIDFSSDSGKTWRFYKTIARGIRFGYFDCPNVNSTQCFIKLSNSTNSSLYTISDIAFSITKAVTIFTPFKGDTFYTCNTAIINFDKGTNFSTYVLEYKEIGTSTWNTIGTTNAAGVSVAYNWTLPQSLLNGKSNDVVIKIYPQGTIYRESYSDTFHIKNSITYLAPTGNQFDYDEYYKPGDTVKIKWKAEGTNNIFDIGGVYTISTTGTTTYTNPKFVVTGYATTTNSYNWIVPANITSFKLIVRDNIDTCKTSLLMKYFAIVSPTIQAVKLIKGNGGDTLTGCSTYTITWQENASHLRNYHYYIYYVEPNGSSNTIATGLPDNTRSYTWTVPNITEDITIRIYSRTLIVPWNQYIDYSDNLLHIKKNGFKASTSDTAVCYGSNVQLDASLGYTNYTWTPNDGNISDTSIRNPIVTVYANKIYTVTANLGTCVVTDDVTVKRLTAVGFSTISIAADTINKCVGKPITVTSNTVFAGSNAVYKWFVNNVLKDSSNSSSFTYKFKQNDSVICRMYSSLCVSNSLAVSNAIKIVFSYTPKVTNSYINSCNNVTYKGNVYTASAIVSDTLKFVSGCDSVYNKMNITIKKITPTNQNVNITGCNTVTFNSIVYTSSTTLKDTLKSYLGCDSIFNVTNITVTSTPPTRDTFATVCSSINWYGNVFTKDTVASYTKIITTTSSLIEGFSAGVIAPTGWVFTQINGTYATAGNFGAAAPSLKFGASNDQIITPTLPAAATQLSFWLKSQGATSCSLKIEGYNGTSWATVNTITTFPTAATTIVYNATSSPALPNGLNKFRFTYTKSAGNISFDDLVINYSGASSGCDSVVRLNLTVNKPTTNNINLSGCVVVYKGITYTSAAIVRDTIKSNLGCDSVFRIANITIAPLVAKDTTLYLSGCNSVTYKGNVYTNSQAFLDTTKSINNCDSVYLAVNITVNHSFSGNIKHPTKGNINNVTVKLNGSNANTITASGSYAFNCLPNSAYGSVKLSKNNDVVKNNGVSSIDMILTTRHILGLTLFNSPYKIIAADVNNNKTVTNIDIIFMKRLILGLDTTFTGNKLWAFVDSAYKFADTTNPFPYKDSINLNYTPFNQTNKTFIGVKLGDVNYDWNASVARTSSSVDNIELIVTDKLLNVTDKQINIPISVNNFSDITALQYTLNFDNNKYEFVAITNNKLEIDFNATQANKTGNIAMLWTGAKGEPTSLKDGTELFTLVLNKKSLTSNEDINNLQLSINNSITDIEAWDNNNLQHNVVLKQMKSKDNLPITSNNWTVYPNPANDVININFGNCKAKQIRIINQFGQIMLQIEKINNNQSSINTSKLVAGVYYIEIITMDDKKEVKKITKN